MRSSMAARHLSGDGIEIGALHRPFPLPPGAWARFVDHRSTAQLREEYPELAGELVAVELVEDGARLASIADGALDFVVHAHVLEHFEDPVGALAAQLRVLRSGGTLLLGIGDRRSGLDMRRPGTTLEHLLADHEDGGAGSRAGHYREWARLVDLPLGYVDEDGVEAHAAALERSGHAIHFHCWAPAELLAQLPAFGLGAELAESASGDEELLVALRRR